MKNLILTALVSVVMTSGCAVHNTAEEYGSNTMETIFACPGENWVSKQTAEKFCLLTSVKDPNSYVLAEDTGETYGEAGLAVMTLGVSMLFEGDTQEEWLRAAKEFAAEAHGDGSMVINFRLHRGQHKAYAFEVIPSSALVNPTDKLAGS